MPTTLERFWSHVLKTESCWLWTGALTKGYGHFRISPRVEVLAHRFAYEQLVGPIADGLELDHLCRTPACVNPAHLEPVTHAVNMARGIFVTAATCKNGHAWTEENTLRVRGRRFCRACNREK